MKNDYRMAADVVNKFFSGISTDKMQEANGFFRSWNEVVGDNIAPHSKVIDVDRGAVIVEVDHPGWAQQLQLRKKQIILQLSRSFPALQIKNLIIRVESECSTPYHKEELTVGAGIPRIEEEPSAVEIKESMNENLKEVLERLKQSIKKGKSSD